ncbi:MAG: VWA domain-containing protein [Kofleriaceae bacterium]
MDLTERLFVRLLSAIRTLGDPRARRRAAGAVELDPLRRHLELLATAVAGRRVELLLAHGDGGAGGDRLVFPASLDALPTARDNAELAILRAVLGGVVLRDPASARPRRDGAATVLATAAALVRARATLADELPGAHARLAPVLAQLRAQRPALTSLRQPARALEAIMQVALGAPPADLVIAAPELPAAALAALAAGRTLDHQPVASPSAVRPSDATAVDAAATWHDLRTLAEARALPSATPLCGWLGATTETSAASAAPSGAAPGSRGGRERAGRAADLVRRRSLPRRDEAENPLTHSFEKVHTLEKHPGGAKRADGADELEAHGDALDELALDELVRSDTTTAGVYRADVPGVELNAAEDAAPPPAPEALRYDEWDERARTYRRGYCLVNIEHHPAEASVETTARFVRAALTRYRRERAELAERLWRLLAQPRRRGGQPDGPEVDLDAITLRHGDLRHGTTGPDKLYVAQPRHAPDLAVALLLDRSLSSDAWVANQRVLDAGVDALIALGSALPPQIARTSVVAFSSHTRHDCRLAILKAFDAPWTAAERRLAALVPEGYTRIGPALRHTTRLLDREPARRKLLVLLSDGKPTDYDPYEGRHGVADVRQSVAEAARAGVFTFAVALDRGARAHLPRMFGPGGFAVVTRPRELVLAVGHLVRQRLAR